MLRTILGVLIAASVVLAGCSGSGGQPTAQPTQKPAAQPAAPSTGQPGQSVTIPGSGGQSLKIDSSLPDELKNFPVPSGFAYDGGGSMSVSGQEGGKTTVATWKGNGSLADAMAFYKNSAAAKGWTEGMSFSDNKGGQLWYTASDGYSYIVTFSTQDNGGLEISVLGGKSNAPTPAPTRAPAALATQAPAAATVAPARPVATPTTAAPATVPVTQMPQELQAIPLPSGFAPQRDGIMRMASGDQLQMATAMLIGTGDPDQIAQFYQGALPSKGWNEEMTMSTGEGMLLTYAGELNGAEYVLNITIATKGAGTEVVLVLMPQ